MVVAELHDGHIDVETEYRDRELIKSVPGHRWDTNRRIWHVPQAWSSCVLLRSTFGDRLEVGPQLNEWALAERKGRIDPCLALREATDATWVNELYARGEDLLPLQRAGASFMAAGQRVLNGDEMGSGKTIETIAALEIMASWHEQGHYPSPFPALVICPNSMRDTWAEEYEKWAPNRRVVVIGGGAAKRRKQIFEEADVFVINWEAIRLHSRVAGYGYIKLTDEERVEKELNERGFVTVVGDEAHRAKSPQAKQTRAWWYLAHKATFCFATTGTPVANSPEDLWSIMHAVAPLEWPGKTSFIDRFALLAWSDFGAMKVVGVKSEAKEDLFKILDPRFIRRPTELFFPQLRELVLPPQTRAVDLLPKQKKAYESIRKEMLAEVDTGVLTAVNPLTKLTRLRQFACAYAEVDEQGEVTLSEPSSKIDALEEIIDELGGKKAVVFSESRQLIELAHHRLVKSGVKAEMVTGTIDPHLRTANVREFQEGATQVLLLTLGAGGEGLTLTAAHAVIHLQRSFSALKDSQANGRVPRIGLDHTIQTIDVIANGTLEPMILEVLREKGERLEEIARDEETLRAWLMK